MLTVGHNADLMTEKTSYIALCARGILRKNTAAVYAAVAVCISCYHCAAITVRAHKVVYGNGLHSRTVYATVRRCLTSLRCGTEQSCASYAEALLLLIFLIGDKLNRAAGVTPEGDHISA